MTSVRGAVAIAAFAVAARSVVSCGGTDCKALESDAAQLRADQETCKAGDTCEIVDLYALAGDPSCIGVFQCSAAFRKGVDLAAFSSRARDLAKRYKDGCNTCAQADCAAPSSFDASCNTVTGRCELVPKGGVQ